MNKNIKKEICVITKDNFDEIINNFNLSNSDGLTAMNIFAQTTDLTKVEDFLNTLNESHFYSLSYQDESNSGKYYVEVVKVDTSKNVDQKTNTSKDSIDMNNIVEMFSPENKSQSLPERDVKNPKTYNLKNIKDILDVLTEENYKYFLYDFESFIKMILKIKKSFELSKNLKNLEKFKDIFSDISNKDLEEGLIIPDNFEWIDDGKTDALGIVEMKDLDGNSMGTIKMDNDGNINDIDISNLSEKDKEIFKRFGIDPENFLNKKDVD